jgi:hypothetical protein
VNDNYDFPEVRVNDGSLLLQNQAYQSTIEWYENQCLKHHNTSSAVKIKGVSSVIVQEAPHHSAWTPYLNKSIKFVCKMGILNPQKIGKHPRDPSRKVFFKGATDALLSITGPADLKNYFSRYIKQQRLGFALNSIMRDGAVVVVVGKLMVAATKVVVKIVVARLSGVAVVEVGIDAPAEGRVAGIEVTIDRTGKSTASEVGFTINGEWPSYKRVRKVDCNGKLTREIFLT